MEKVDYDGRQHAVYAQGRAVSPAMIAAWMKVFAGHGPARRPLAVPDLGCGTGAVHARPGPDIRRSGVRDRAVAADAAGGGAVIAASRSDLSGWQGGADPARGGSL